MAKAKKDLVEPVKLTDEENDLLQGWLARQELVRIQAQTALAEAQAKIDAIAGDGMVLKAEQDGVYRVPKE